MLRSYLVGCATGGASCIPIDTSPLLPGVVAPETTPVISGGRVFAMSTGNVSSFDAECLACGAHWSSSGGAPGARGGLVVAGGMVYAQRGERLAAYPVVCGEGGATCAPTWSATLPLNGPPTEGGLAYADGMVWASFSRRISGIVARCGTGGATCTPLVSIPTHAVSETTPLVVDGRIYIGTDDTMSAYGIPDN
jgi:outer membrane protein assembly factor BamB